MATNSSSPNNSRPQSSGIPSSSTFSFKAPFPVSSAAGVSALKHRRVSLASPSSPRIVQPWSFRDEMGLHPQASQDASSSNADDGGSIVPEKKGKMRKIDPTQGSDDSPPPVAEKKPRKKWSTEETQMLVQGCQLHGVGNWKTILQDPDLKFLDRSAVDLKDRFRTYFPDAYKRHYPNARTHLSSKIRSTFADGTSLFEKTRSKRRRPFTEAEDRALKAGYEKHGTTWATIVKDPIFQEQSRRSTDLRDRFRNAFPDLYQAAGYKPRTAAKKKIEGPVRAADDQLSMSTTGPVRSRRRAKTSQGLLRGGTKSVPQSTAVSEDEESSGGEEEDSETSLVFKTPPTPVFVDNVSTMPFRPFKKPSTTTTASSSSAPTLSSSARDSFNMDADDEMQLIASDTDPLHIPDFLPNNTHSDMETWSSGLNTPTHSSTAAWSTAAASPTSSHLSDFLMNAAAASGTSNNLSNASSPFIHRRHDGLGNNFGMIGKSAWGTDDWFSPNPRLDARSATSSSASSSFIDGSFSPASPFSFNPHNVLDRYDLFPPYMPDGNSSEAGVGDTHTAFSDELGGGGGAGGNGGGASAGGTGFKGYHSQIAGDLISGAGARTSSSLSLSLSSIYSSSFGNGFGSGNGGISGLGLDGIPENAGIHPMQLHSHTSNLLAIDELGLTGISLNDHVDSSGARNVTSPGSNIAPDVGDAMETAEGGGVLGMSFGMARSPQKQHHRQRSQGQKEKDEDLDSSLNSDSFGLEDLVDMNELHATPPATPLLTQPRPMRRSSGGAMLHNVDGPGHARSISVPPSEARNGGAHQGVPMSMDDVGLHMHTHSGMQPEFGMVGRTLHSFFNLPSTPSGPSSANTQQQQQQQQRHTNSEPMRLSNNSGSVQSPISPVLQQQHSSQLTPLFPGHLILSPSSSSGIASPNSSQQLNSNHPTINDNNLNNELLWRSAIQSSGDYSYNLPFLDLHYYGHPAYGSMMSGHSHNSLGLDVTLDDHSEARQGQALDLAQSAALASSGMAGLGLNLGLPLRALDTPSPVGTIRHHTREKPGLPESFVAAAATNPHGRQPEGVATNDTRGGIRDAAGRAPSTGTGTIRQAHIKANAGPGTIGRSMSHHRGQSAVCPQDLMLRNDNKRKRASWDGGVV
ncbi:hypothetical protein BDZ97DRAFT_1758781 [Flammula alnicola]|nr:hypothetical protein BDZ97DRAFT_1758781 [Flammula alnicola]